MSERCNGRQCVHEDRVNLNDNMDNNGLEHYCFTVRSLTVLFLGGSQTISFAPKLPPRWI